MFPQEFTQKIRGKNHKYIISKLMEAKGLCTLGACTIAKSILETKDYVLWVHVPLHADIYSVTVLPLGQNFKL